MTAKSVSLLSLLLLVGLVGFAAGLHSFHEQRGGSRVQLSADSSAAAPPTQPSPSYRVLYYNQTLDHFNFQTQNLKWPQRYIFSADYWVPSEGPILFYTGNEGDIFMFWNNTGFMYYLAEKFHGLLIFAEHRYYGESMPFGADSLQLENIGYLTSEQALADYAELIRYLKETLPGAKDVPVVAFGGSYGGMLSSWFRIKYPYLIDGALASSAPVAWFGNLTSPYAFYEIVTADFARSGPQCADNIRTGFVQIMQTASTSGGLLKLSRAFNLCKPMLQQSEVNDLVNYLQTAYTYMAMTDYPYPSDFLQPMPAWPVRAACKFLPPNDTDLFAGMLAAAQVYYGPSNCTQPVTPASPSLGDQQWNYQACSEMVQPISSNGITDMFLPYEFNLTQTIAYCAYAYHTTTRPLWIPLQYGARDVGAASNIIYSNGELDPWRAGGVLQSPAPDRITCLTIADAAHHLDLRYPNAADPPPVTEARATEEAIIRTWIEQARKTRSSRAALPR